MIRFELGMQDVANACMSLMCLVIALTLIMQTWPLWRKPLVGMAAGLVALIGISILTYAGAKLWHDYQTAQARTRILREPFRLDLNPQSSELKPYEVPGPLEPYK